MDKLKLRQALQSAQWISDNQVVRVTEEMARLKALCYLTSEMASAGLKLYRSLEQCPASDDWMLMAAELCCSVPAMHLLASALETKGWVSIHDAQEVVRIETVVRRLALDADACNQMLDNQSSGAGALLNAIDKVIPGTISRLHLGLESLRQDGVAQAVRPLYNAEFSRFMNSLCPSGDTASND